MTASIYFHPEGYSTNVEKLMGRHAAGESFLEGYFQHSTFDGPIYVHVDEQKHYDIFESTARAYNRTENIEAIIKNQLGNLRKPGTLHLPGPALSEQALRRSLYGNDQWSLTGITHTTSSSTAMDSISGFLVNPVQPWDALICTSNAVRKNVEVVIDANIDYLRNRLGASKFSLPQLPVIPLGINTGNFSYDEADKESARKALNVNSESIVVLYVGRLSFHAKAHPLPMYKALEIAAKSSNKDIILIECGWHANEYIESAFIDSAALGCPSVKVIRLDGREALNRKIAWAGSDVFCSLSDNIQETFGIVPIEAMSAGLPVVVSDWDGYKETVRNDIDGFRIPTIAPSPGLGGDLAHRHALGIDTYDMYCGHSSSLISVDIAAAANAFHQLFISPELRKKMGAAGKSRAIETYDWREIIKKYEELWSELSSIRKNAQAEYQGQVKNPWPARLDPTIAFAHYPTSHMTDETMLGLACPRSEFTESDLANLKNLKMISYANYIFPTENEIATVLTNASDEMQPVRQILQGIEPSRRPYVLRGLVWLAKIGVLRTS